MASRCVSGAPAGTGSVVAGHHNKKGVNGEGVGDAEQALVWGLRPLERGQAEAPRWESQPAPTAGSTGTVSQGFPTWSNSFAQSGSESGMFRGKAFLNRTTLLDQRDTFRPPPPTKYWWPECYTAWQPRLHPLL